MESDTLYLAATTGAKSYGGVPAQGLIANFLICYFGYMVIGSADIFHFKGYIWLLLFCMVHLGMKEAIDYDPNIFRILEVSISTFAVRRMLWSALPFFARKAEDMQSAL